MSKSWIPQAGDLIKLDLEPRIGHEQAGWRPALVISEGAYNRPAGLCLVCPVTSQVNGYPFEVRLPDRGGIAGVILSDHVKSVDFKARHAKLIDTAPREVLDIVRGYVALLIGAK
ncbi:MAG TPA: type II toxin-antitoxin system PemK/MazF family toxin [Bryobacteraceae bacterium]|nr:type II toxin-antitoxin system PemK/MazF family toxin [Bryobacteraceae bacterium]